MSCMRCLICVSLGDVWGTVLRYDSTLVLSLVTIRNRDSEMPNAWTRYRG